MNKIKSNKQKKADKEFKSYLIFMKKVNLLLMSRYPKDKIKAYKLLKMTFADGLKPVVSRDGSVPRTSLNINLSLASQGRLSPKSLLCDMLKGTSPNILSNHLIGGGRYDYESISSLQSANTRFRCQDCGCKEWKSLQVQYQLSFYMDTKIQEENALWKGERSA